VIVEDAADGVCEKFTVTVILTGAGCPFTRVGA
jgi:hypothetical protein